MSDPIKIVVTAETAEAAAKLQAFAQQAASGMSAEVIKAGNAAAGNLRTANMMFIGMAQGMSAQMIAGMDPIRVMAVQVPAVVQAVNMLGVGFAAMLPYVAAVGVAAGVGVLEWKLYMGSVEDTTTKIHDMVAALEKVPGILERIAALQKAGVISPAAAAQYADYLNGKKKLFVGPDGKVTPNATTAVEELGTTGSNLYGGTPDNKTYIRNVANREATQAERNAYIASQPAFDMVAQAQADAKNKLDELLAKSSVEMLSGVDKDIAGIQQRYSKLREDLQLTLQQAGGLVGPNEKAAAQAQLAALNTAEARQIAEARGKAQADQVKQAEADRKEIVLQNQRELDAALDAYAAANTTKTKEYWETVYNAKIAAARRAFDVDEDDLALQKKIADATRERAAGLKQVTAEAERQAAAARDYARARIEGDLSAVRGNPLLTQGQKDEQSIPLMQALQISNLQRIADLTQTINTTEDAAARIQAQRELVDLTRQQADLTNELAAKEHPWATQFTQLQSQAELTAQNVATTFGNVFNSMIGSISNGITGLIMGTMSWGQFLMQIPRQIMTEIVGAIVQMGVRWIATQILMATVGRSIAVAQLAALLPIAAAESAIFSTPAALATISSYGGAAVAAPFQIAGALAMTRAFTAFETGGFTGGRRGEAAGIVHGEEYVFSAPAVDRIGLDNLEAMHSGRSSAAGGGGNGGSGAGGATKVINVFDRAALQDELKKADYANVIVNHVMQNKTRIGIQT